MLCVCKMAHAPGAKPVAQRQAAPAMGAAAEGGSGLDDELQVGGMTGPGVASMNMYFFLVGGWTGLSCGLLICRCPLAGA